MLTEQGLELSYGLEFDSNDPMLEEILIVEKEIIHARSVVHNREDYLPSMRIWPFTTKNTHSLPFRQRRDVYMNKLFNMLEKSIEAKSCPPCIIGNILQSDKPCARAITEQELRSICLTMVSAGLDTIPASVVACIGYLANSTFGQAIQAQAYQEIQSAYPQGDAWQRCTDDEYVPYITMLIKETLRYSSIQPIGLPRETVSNIIYNNAVIPPGTILLMNTLASNFDSTHFRDPFRFDPERFRYSNHGDIDHMGFGAGSRNCAGAKLAEREMYTMLVRLIVKFKILPAKNKADDMQTDVFRIFKSVDNMVVEPRPFLVRLELR